MTATAQPNTINPETGDAGSQSVAPSLTPVVNNAPVRGMTSLLDALFAKGMISADDLKTIKFESISFNKNIEDVLVSKGIIKENDVQRVKAEMHGIGFVDLAAVSIPHDILNRIPQELAKNNDAVAYDETPLALKVAMVDPLDLQKIQFIESVVSKKVDAYYAAPTEVSRVINTKYGAQISKEVNEALADVSTNVYDLNSKTEDLASNTEEAPVIRIVNLVLDYAVKHGASDVHIEPRETRIAVRYRVNGILSEKLTIPMKLAAPVITRIKILSTMKIDEHRIPQDGRFQVKVEDKIVDLRVSVLPTVYGEKVVMRLLEKANSAIDIDKIGLRGPGYTVFRGQLDRTQGLILVTGPTGSGKTQTLAGCLKILNREEVNTMTLEDPVEIRIEGVNQVQINSEVGLTFANGLRAFLRQDPNIIMIGEIRDSETAKLAIQAALTGHLVLATLHTNSAAAALPRLIEMGVEPYLLASTINIVLAQRLVRKLDLRSAQPYQPNAEMMKKIHEVLDPLQGFRLKDVKGELVTFTESTDTVKLYKPVPTPESESGYASRVGIFEVLNISDDIKEMIMAQKSGADIQKTALNHGMVTMIQDGFMKAIEGVTTLEEVLRVIN